MHKHFALMAVISFGIVQGMMALTPASDTLSSKTAKATFGGGCFWCLDAAFEQLPGVLKVTSGFAGGTTSNPTYEEVCSGGTGHAEVVQITYDPAKVTYDQLLDLFWKVHDPTTLNRQGADHGTQYRSIILTSTPDEEAAARSSKKKAASLYGDPIVTEIKPLTAFYPAEVYHQDYYRNNKDRNPYCQVVIAPKLKKLGLKQ
jgi:peptide-methionine (S)-S-oxide reductase